MKKMKIDFKQFRLGLIPALLVLFSLLSMNVSAQYFPAMVSEAYAQAMLQEEIPNQENILNSFAQGTAEHEVALRRYQMYVHTWEMLSSGETLSSSLVASYGEFGKVQGNQANADELMAFQEELYLENKTYGDQAFDDLVEFLSI